METFMTDVSSVIRNCAEARINNTADPRPDPGARAVRTSLESSFCTWRT
jgi:hypothetical protein